MQIWSAVLIINTSSLHFKVILVQVNPGEAFTIRREDGQFQCITGKNGHLLSFETRLKVMIHKRVICLWFLPFFLTATTPRHELCILYGLTITNCSLFPRVSWLIYYNVVHVTPGLKNLWWIQFSFLSLFERSFHHSCLLFPPLSFQYCFAFTTVSL